MAETVSSTLLIICDQLKDVDLLIEAAWMAGQASDVQNADPIMFVLQVARDRLQEAEANAERIRALGIDAPVPDAPGTSNRQSTASC